MLRSLLENEERPAKWAERSWLPVLRIEKSFGAMKTVTLYGVSLPLSVACFLFQFITYHIT
jgi:hypothetical protein